MKRDAGIRHQTKTRERRQEVRIVGGDDDIARQRQTHAGTHGGAVDRRHDRESKPAQAKDQRIHEAAHFEMRPLPAFMRFQIDGMKIEAAAKDIVAAGDDHRSGTAFTLLNLIERQMYRANDGDIDRVAAR